MLVSCVRARPVCLHPNRFNQKGDSMTDSSRPPYNHIARVIEDKFETPPCHSRARRPVTERDASELFSRFRVIYFPVFMEPLSAAASPANYDNLRDDHSHVNRLFLARTTCSSLHEHRWYQGIRQFVSFRSDLCASSPAWTLYAFLNPRFRHPCTPIRPPRFRSTVRCKLVGNRFILAPSNAMSGTLNRRAVLLDVTSAMKAAPKRRILSSAIVRTNSGDCRG